MVADRRGLVCVAEGGEIADAINGVISLFAEKIVMLSQVTFGEVLLGEANLEDVGDFKSCGVYLLVVNSPLTVVEGGGKVGVGHLRLAEAFVIVGGAGGEDCGDEDGECEDDPAGEPAGTVALREG